MLARLLAVPVLLVSLVAVISVIVACDPVGPPDASSEGEPCHVSEVVGDCRTGGVDGLEYCAFSVEAQQSVWTACLTETCEQLAKQRSCDEGVQYCAAYEVAEGEFDLRWGACGEPAECTPGETLTCAADEAVTNTCVRNADGRGVWDPHACDA